MALSLFQQVIIECIMKKQGIYMQCKLIQSMFLILFKISLSIGNELLIYIIFRLILNIVDGKCIDS